MPDRFQQRRTAARVGLLHRVIGVRRAQAPLPDGADRRPAAPSGDADPAEAVPEPAIEPGVAEALERRIARLEAQVEDLQDALHRTTVRQERHLEEVDHRLDPAVLARALSEDARRRGL